MAEDKKTILVVEDEPSLQEAIVMKFQNDGYEVMAAGTGEDALEMLKQKRPTLVWLDLLLPKMNGMEVLQKIKSDPETNDLPVVVVSVSASQDNKDQAFGMGVIDYIVKSEGTISSIIKRVEEYINK